MITICHYVEGRGIIIITICRYVEGRGMYDYYHMLLCSLNESGTLRFSLVCHQTSHSRLSSLRLLSRVAKAP